MLAVDVKCAVTYPLTVKVYFVLAALPVDLLYHILIACGTEL